DHEVNIKVLLNQVVEAGDLTEKQRRELLAEMTDDVANLVLRNNYLQTQALSMAGAQTESMFEVHARVIRELERQGRLERGIEFLPTEDEILERKTSGLAMTGPELSVLMAYVKIELFKALQESRIGDEPALHPLLVEYFPAALRARYADIMSQHRLANEIVATVAANNMVNRGGITFWHRIAEETGSGAREIAHAYFAATSILELDEVYSAVEALDNRVPAALQIQMLLDARRLAERVVRWLLRNRSRPLDIAATVTGLRSGVAEVARLLPEYVAARRTEDAADPHAALVEQGVPESLARRVQCFDPLYSALDIVEVAADAGEPVGCATQVYFAIGNALGLSWLHDQVNALPRANRWQTLARNALRDDLYAQERLLTLDALRLPADGGGADVRMSEWLDRSSAGVERCLAMLSDIQSTGTPDFAMLSVLIRELRSLRTI
ncbi:MAG: NAD-glutamate dehydrogenase, partial [Gammaproteobacteria bacterium]|nr:NAD-glutamate dehydrogenase [Gammaproteobacteria bacterium]